MPLSIGVNLRVTGHCNQGGRKYMEDMFSVAYQQSSNDRELEYAFFGIFDGHGGGEAALFAKENLMDIIVKQKNFWSDNDEDVLKAIRDGYVNTHYAMWRELDKWPRTAAGLPSTAGTTASVAFIRKGKIYIGHVGDSAIILGYQQEGDSFWRSKALTKDHKPESFDELTRIRNSGGKVVPKSGVPRVVWNRPKIGHKGPVRRSTPMDEIPFLAVARSLGDLWSYNSELDTFVVSPEPDVRVLNIDVKTHRCLIFGTDGLWNVLSAQTAVETVQAAEKHNEKHLIASQQTGVGRGVVQMWINPSKSLVDKALERWSETRLRADNTSVVTLMLDPPGPTHNELLLSQKREQLASTQNPVDPTPDIQEQTGHSQESSKYQQQMSPIKSNTNPQICPRSPMVNPPPSYEIHKPPDSSNHLPPDMSISTSDESLDNVFKEHIQVDEVSSSDLSNYIPSNLNAGESTNEKELTTVESSSNDSVFETDKAENGQSDSMSHEHEKYLQEVPEPEKYIENTTDLKTIENSEASNKLKQNELDCSLGVKRVVRVKRKNSDAQATHSWLRLGTKRGIKERKLQHADDKDLKVNTENKFFNTINKSHEVDKVEQCLNRQTRSEVLRSHQDENEPANQKHELRHTSRRWSANEAIITKTNDTLNTSENVQERRLSSPNCFKRRSLEKKVLPVKTIRRPTSITRSTGTRLQQMRDNFYSRERQSISMTGDSTTPKRWLRSDTIAATPTKTLRSRNVDITGTPILTNKNLRTVASLHKLKSSEISSVTTISTSVVSPPSATVSRMRSSSAVNTQSSTAKPIKAKQSYNATHGVSSPSMNTTTSSSMTKSKKTPYNPTAASFSTRSRLKRFSSNK
ncbi:uncharacterized protein LOC106652435 [Trichogramma pretiosum]|uniref:uncharacterized protein LOC106652435 n=1 Tax=Trichogramma pretiosum TaxID=7493 RepID=UPI0006C99218|nr:uncharacterized protein LOC106652435 [Trichogramma pretiosum]